jgi:hypothetical protein
VVLANNLEGLKKEKRKDLWRMRFLIVYLEFPLMTRYVWSAFDCDYVFDSPCVSCVLTPVRGGTPVGRLIENG